MRSRVIKTKDFEHIVASYIVQKWLYKMLHRKQILQLRKIFGPASSNITAPTQLDQLNGGQQCWHVQPNVVYGVQRWALFILIN